MKVSVVFIRSELPQEKGEEGGRQTGRWRVSYFSVISVGEEDWIQDVSVGSHPPRSSLSKGRSLCATGHSGFEMNSICAPEEDTKYQRNTY